MDALQLFSVSLKLPFGLEKVKPELISQKKKKKKNGTKVMTKQKYFVKQLFSFACLKHRKYLVGMSFFQLNLLKIKIIRGTNQI